MGGKISLSDPRGEYEEKKTLHGSDRVGTRGRRPLREKKKLMKTNTHAACILRSRISTIKKTQETKQREIIMLICERKQKKREEKKTHLIVIYKYWNEEKTS